MRRVLLVLIAILIGWLGVPQAHAAESSTSASTYTYDRHDGAAVPTGAAIERGPPAVAYDHSTLSSDGIHGSPDAWARPHLGSIWTYTTYDHTARSAQLDSRIATTRMAAHARPGDLRSDSGASVAAKAGTSAADRALAQLPKAARESPKPPGWNPETWQWREGSRANVPRSWWDPEGGEWRFHPEDKWHDPHWDYNPWEQWNTPWQHLYPGDG